MKKIIFLFICLVSLSIFFFAQESEDAFDFDSLFEDVEDVEAVVEEIPIQKEPTEKTKSDAFSFSGTFSANIGLFAQYPKNTAYFGGGLQFKNELSFLAKASAALALQGSLLTNEKIVTDGVNAITLTSLYFDYLMFNRLLFTAGKKAYSWGNTLYFGSNVLEELEGFSKHISVQLVFPLSPFTLSLLGMYNGKVGETMNPSLFDLATAIEASLWQTNVKAFSRYWSNTSTASVKKIVFGLEWKRDILGLDFYQQALYYSDLRDIVSFNPEKIQLISGLSQFWEGKYKTALLIEHKWKHTFFNDSDEQFIALNTGISRLLQGRLKLGLQAEHAFLTKSGKIHLVAVLPGAEYGFPHADLQFGIPVSYDKSANIDFKLGVNLALSFSY
jgi:hypothetical protein